MVNATTVARSWRRGGLDASQLTSTSHALLQGVIVRVVKVQPKPAARKSADMGVDVGVEVQQYQGLKDRPPRPPWGLRGSNAKMPGFIDVPCGGRCGGQSPHTPMAWPPTPFARRATAGGPAIMDHGFRASHIPPSRVSRRQCIRGLRLCHRDLRTRFRARREFRPPSP